MVNTKAGEYLHLVVWLMWKACSELAGVIVMFLCFGSELGLTGEHIHQNLVSGHYQEDAN